MNLPDRESLMREILASVVVFLVALPLCLGIAIASGAPPVAGLITGVIGGLLVGSLAGSPLQVSGPAAGLAVIVYEVINTHGMAGLGVVVFIAGLLQMGAGWMKLGQWFRAISPAVIYGMLAGIGVLIFAAQFHVMVDDKPRDSGWRNLIDIPDAIYRGITNPVHRPAALIGIATIAILVAWKAFAPAKLKWMPGALVAVVFATVAAAVQGLPVQYVQIPSDLFGEATFLSVEGLKGLANPALLIAAFTVAFVASAETLLSASAVDRMHDGPRTNYDKELFAQGVGNSLCGILGALPMTGVIVRSATNVTAGARTRLSTIFHGAWMLVFVLAFPFLLRMIPTAALAAILVYTGYNLVAPANIRRLAAYGRMPVLIYAATLVFIVGVDMLTGIVIGLALSAVQILYRLTHFDVKVQQEESGIHVHLSGAGTFMRLPRLLASLESLPLTVPVHVHVRQVAYVDDAIVETLAAWERQRRMQGGIAVLEWDRVIGIYGDRHSADQGRIRQLVMSGASAGH